MKQKNLNWVWVVLFYTFFAIVVTWPIVLHFDTSIYSIYGDSIGTLWGIWWTKYALINLHHTPFSIELIAAPFSSTTSHPELDAFLVLPITAIFNEIAAYNFLNLLGFVLGGLGMFLLVRHLLEKSDHQIIQSSNHLTVFLSALLAGVIFAFSPFHFARALGHWDLAQIQWVPFVFLFLIRFDQNKKVGDLIALLFFALLTFVVNPYFGIFLPIAVLIFYLLKIFSEKNKQKALISFIVVLIVAICAFGTIRLLNIEGAKRAEEDLSMWKLKPIQYLIPSPVNPYFGQYFKNVFNQNLGSSNITEVTAFIGFIALVLAIIGLLTNFRKNYYWLIIGAVAFLITLGPSPLGIYFYKLAPFIRSLNRFSVFVQLSIAVLAGYGFYWLVTKVKKEIFIYLLFIVLIFFIIGEYFNATPHRVILANQGTKATDWLKKNVYADEIILQIPMQNKAGNQSPETLYFQRLYRKKLFNDLFPNNTKIPGMEKDFWYQLNHNPKLIEGHATTDKLKNYGVKYIVVFPEVPAEEAPREVPDFSKNSKLELFKTFNREGVIFNDLRDNWQKLDIYQIN